MADKIAPVGNRQRIEYLDVVRGIAILGILIANIAWFSLYAIGLKGRFHFDAIDRIVVFLQYMFIEGKFYSIFSLLFGWGIAIQINKFGGNNAAASGFLLRRLFVLLVLGAIHMLFIWEGDIVFFYALVGFALVFLRRLSNKILVITGIFLILSPILLYYLKMKFPVLNAPVEILKRWGEQIYQTQGWVNQDESRTGVLRESKSLLTNLWITFGDAPYRFAYVFFTSRLSKILGAVLIGFVIGRSGIYPAIIKHKKKLIGWGIFTLIISLPLNYLVALYMFDSASYNALTSKGLLFSSVYAIGVFPLSMVYLIFFALIFENEKVRNLLLFISPAGKMAFTNYIMQSILGIVLFYRIGFGLMEQFGPLFLTFLALVIFISQTIFSKMWLSVFRFGPLEWLWRSLTYGQKQPFMKFSIVKKATLKVS